MIVNNYNHNTAIRKKVIRDPSNTIKVYFIRFKVCSIFRALSNNYIEVLNKDAFSSLRNLQTLYV